MGQQKILITGAAGFIGSSLLEELIKKDKYYVVAVDNLLTGKVENLPQSNPQKWKFIQTDVNNHKEISAVMMSEKFDYVFHYAAVVGVKRTLANPLIVLQDIEGFKNILQLCVKTKVKRIFFSSSSEIYGEPVEIPENEETTPLNARLPYAVVKNIGEVFVKSFYKEYGLPYTILRFFNTYGPKQSEDFVISKFLKQSVKGKEITVYGDGMQTRTFCYINDNLDATIKMLEENLGTNEIINIGSDAEVTIMLLAKMILEVSESKAKIVHLPALLEGDMTRRVPDNTKMKKILERELITLKEGLTKLINNQL